MVRSKEGVRPFSGKLPAVVPHQSPHATTTASRLKTLVLHVDRHYGRAQADGLLVTTKLDRGYLSDETRSIPVEIWYHVLLSFTARFGRDELKRIVPAVVDRENLGVWSKVLRGAESPIDAYRQLGMHGGEDTLTERWETLELDEHHFLGRVRVRATEPEERDGLCAMARAAELASIPLLFGMREARVHTELPPAVQAGLLEQRFRVVWRRPFCCSPHNGAVLGAAVGASVTALSWGVEFELLGAAAAVGAGLGVLSSFGLSAFYTARRVGAAQVMRLRALERSAALRENRERHEAVGATEGTFIAGQYQLTANLGSGASGAIWEAVRLSDGKVVAIKLLRAAVAHDTVAADRLRREAAALGLAWHPNVVEVYDEGHLPDGTSYLVMERLHGVSLSAKIRRDGPMSPAELLPLALQVCEALGAVHAAGIVHRDLKPSNVFLADPESDSEGPFRVKILDFGIARVEWAETRLTNAGAPLGTPGYMSPEQEQGLEIDARSDLFSLGTILFECLTGSPPPLRSAEFHSEASTAANPESLVQIALDRVPVAWRRIIERATHPLPKNRYVDARAMQEGLLELRLDPAREKHSA